MMAVGIRVYGLEGGTECCAFWTRRDDCPTHQFTVVVGTCTGSTQSKSQHRGGEMHEAKSLLTGDQQLLAAEGRGSRFSLGV